MAFIKKDGNSMGLPMNINRGNPIPIDTTELWYSFEEAQTYARSGATAYVGQQIAVVDEANGTVALYVIKNTQGELMPLSEGNSSTSAKLEWGALGSK